jgi:hypothetical protein
LIAAAVLLLISVLAAAFCLMTKTTSHVSVEQLKSAWKRAAAQIEEETVDDPLRPVAGQGITIRALLEGQPNDDKKKDVPAALDALRAAAKTKAWALRVTVGTFAAGAGITGIVAIKTIKGVMGSG